MIGKIFLDKHKKYKDSYGKNELYWGIGIENETYLEFDKNVEKSLDFFKNNHKRERYSVDYFNSYRDLDKAFEEYIYIKLEKKENIELPLLINSHTFLYTDKNNNHKTTYTIKPKPNPQFTIALDDFLKNKCEYFENNFNKSFTYDGDVIEFMTQKFYNTTIDECVKELLDVKTEFIENVSLHFPIKTYGNIRFMKENYPFGIYLTNPDNIAMFNNGTYHFNFTLPTFLDNNGSILNKEKFINDHKKAIRLFQLVSPILIAVYGTPDPFSEISPMFSACSQRCAISRYIGIGTYDTDTMTPGKLLVKNIKDIQGYELPFWWYHQYYSTCSYKRLTEIGFDVNFNKHYLHGIEIRLFDYFPEELLPEILRFLVHVFDHSLELENIPNVVYIQEWNNMTSNIIREGKKYILSSSELYTVNEIFKIEFQPSTKSLNVLQLYNIMRDILEDIYKENGKCSRHMLKQNEKVFTTTKECSKKSVKPKQCCEIL